MLLDTSLSISIGQYVLDVRSETDFELFFLLEVAMFMIEG
jgi:hypothetical protein